MKKIPKDPNWHYLKWLGIAVISILLFGIINNIDKSLSILSFILKVLSPIFIGIFIAFILNIPVNFIEYKVFRRLTVKNGRIWSKIKRALSISLSLLFFFLIITLLLSYIIPEFWRTCQGFIEKSPKYMEDLTATLREWIITLKLPIDPESVTISWDIITSWIKGFVGDSSKDIFQTTLNTAITLFSSVWNIILGFILAIYILASKESLVKLLKGFLYSIAKKEKVDGMVSVFHLSKKAFEGFVAGQCIEVMLIGTLTFIGMTIFQFPYALMVSCIIAATAFIPIFGAITGAIIGALLILLVDPVKAIWFLIFIIILQQVESNLLYPKIMGQQIGLPSLWVLVAVILGGEFFGIPGIIISVPLCSVIYTLLHEWILKRLREKRLCRKSASHIPTNPTPLSEEEFLAKDPLDDDGESDDTEGAENSDSADSSDNADHTDGSEQSEVSEPPQETTNKNKNKNKNDKKKKK